MVNKLDRTVPTSRFKSMFVNELVAPFLMALTAGITQKNPPDGKQMVGLVNVILTLTVLS